MMEQLIKDMIERMYRTVETSVPENGDFKPLFEGFDNPDKNLVVGKFWLDVRQPPEGIETRDWMRVLRFRGNRLDTNLFGSAFIEADKKEVLLQKLRDPEFPQELLELTKEISCSLLGL